MTTHSPLGVAGAILEQDGRISSGFGLQGRGPSAGLDVCPTCQGHGHFGATNSLVVKPCGRCEGRGQVVKV